MTTTMTATTTMVVRPARGERWRGGVGVGVGATTTTHAGARARVEGSSARRRLVGCARATRVMGAGRVVGDDGDDGGGGGGRVWGVGRGARAGARARGARGGEAWGAARARAPARDVDDGVGIGGRAATSEATIDRVREFVRRVVVALLIGAASMTLIPGSANAANAAKTANAQPTTSLTTKLSRDFHDLRTRVRTSTTRTMKDGLQSVGYALAKFEEKTQENWGVDDVWVLIVWNWCIRQGREKLHNAIQSLKSKFDASRTQEPFDNSFLSWFKAPMQVVQALFVISWIFDIACDLIDQLSTEWDIPLPIRVGFDKGSYTLSAGVMSIMFVQKYLPPFLTKVFPSLTGNDTSVQFVITRLTSALMVVATLMLTLSAFGIPAKVLFSFGGLGGLAFGLAAKDFISNLIGGLVLAVLRPFKVGEKIYLTGGGGKYRDSKERNVSNYKVAEIGWYQTKLIPKDGKVTTIPNGYFLGANVINSSRAEYEFFGPSLRIAFPDVNSIEAMTTELRTYLENSRAVHLSYKKPMVFAKKIEADHIVVQIESYIWDVYYGPDKPDKAAFVLGRQKLVIDVVNIVRKHCPNSPVLPIEIQSYADAQNFV